MPKITGPLTPTSPSDSYPTHDSVYGLGGFREVADHAALNAIPDFRRREGMLVYTANDTLTWQLNAGPWVGDDTDWLPFQPGGGTPAWGAISGSLSAQTDLQNALNLKAALASPAFTGVPTVPTAALGTNTTQAASTAFVGAALNDLIGAAPGALDTLNELAAALGDDPNFASTVATSIGGKLSIASNLSDVATPVTAFSNIKQAATSSTTGVIQLAGDIGGTAAAPLVKRTSTRTVATLASGFVADYYCDGVDDEVQINAAIADTGDVYILPGYYAISNGGVNLVNAMYLRGAGWNQTILAGQVDLPGGIFVGSGYSAADPWSDGRLADMKLDGSLMPNTLDTSHKGVLVNHTFRMVLENLWVYRTPATGIGPDYNVQGSIHNCIAEETGRAGGNPGYNGFGIGNGDPGESLTLTDCKAINVYNNGFLFERQFAPEFEAFPRNIQLVNCYAYGCRRGFRGSSVSGISYVNCKAEANIREGFLADKLSISSPPSSLEYIGCESRNNGDDGFFAGEDPTFRDILYSGCHSEGNLGDGFRCSADRLKVVNCWGWNNRDSGLNYHPIGGNSVNTDGPRRGSVQALTAHGNSFWNNGQGNTNGTGDGMLISGGTWPVASASLLGNFCYDDQAIPTQNYGIELLGSVSNANVNGNTAHGNKKGGIYAVATSTSIVNNVRLTHNQTYNNGRGLGSAPERRGIYVSAPAGATYDGLVIQDNRSFDNQDAIRAAKPSVAVATSSAASVGMLTGAYIYKITFVNGTGETAGGDSSDIVDVTANQIGIVFAQGPTGTTARKIYRTAANGLDGTQKLVATISNNSATTYVDNIADGSLGADVPTVDTSGMGVVADAPDAHLKLVDTPIAGNLTGAYLYKVTFVNAAGETAGGITSSSVSPSAGQVKLTDLPIGPYDTTSRKIYRTAAGGADGTQLLLATIANNTDVMYVDNIVDGSLGAAVPVTNTAFAKTQTYGAFLTGAITSASVLDNDFRGNLTDALSISTVTNIAEVVMRNNKGWNPEIVYAQGNVTGATTFNRLNGNVISATLTGNITPTLTTGKAIGDHLTLILTQDATGGRAASGWSSNAKLTGGAVMLSTEANAVDVIDFVWDGTNWRETNRALSTSVHTRRIVQIQVTDPAGAALTTGDGKAYFTVPFELNGYNLVDADASVITPSSSGLPTIQIANVTDSVDMLSTKITIDASENTSYTATTAAVIDTTKDDVATGDILRIDVDVAGTGAAGLSVILSFQVA